MKKYGLPYVLALHVWFRVKISHENLTTETQWGKGGNS